MKTRWTLVSLITLAAMLLLVNSPVKADGIIIPSPEPPCLEGRVCPTLPVIRPMAQLQIRYHHVDVKIDRQTAVTHVDQVFYNPNEWQVEGTYTFPLPLEATVQKFTLWMDGEPVEGKILNAEDARKNYEEIVRQMKDPALLEYAGRGAFQARIFPIPPGGERRIELEYSQVLTSTNGLVRYTYPLNTEKFSTVPLNSVRISVDVVSDDPLRAVYSSSHTLAVSRDGDYGFKATYEESNVTPDTDFTLYYSLGDQEAFHLFSYRPVDTKDPDGYFMILMSPSPGEEKVQVGKDLLLVLDRSGSMEGEKFRQAQAALKYILNHLNPGDRFFLMTFSSGIDRFSTGLMPSSEAAAAALWVDGLGAAGSTDINRALLEAAAVVDRERPSYLIFLTDGLPTQGVTESDVILGNFAQNASQNLRVFSFGVGYDVDTFLLDTLSQDHHGLSTYVQPGEALDEVLSAFYARISTPVMTDLKLDFGGLTVHDIYPDPLPDLFAGSQVVVVGRYRGGGTYDLTLKGNVNDEIKKLSFPESVFTQKSSGAEGAEQALPRLWATRKIGALLNQIRLKGPDQETIDQIVRLSIRYGIVTPYTSFLVTEPMPLGEANQSRVADETYRQMQAAPTAPSFGQAAVEKAAEQGALQRADVAPSAPQPGNQLQAQIIRIIGDSTFVLTEGVWIDTRYDPEKMQPRNIPFLSEDYFILARTRPDLAGALALGEKVIMLVDGQALAIVDSSDTGDPLRISTLAPQPETPSQALTQGPEVTAKPFHPEPTPTPTPTAGGNVPQGGLCPAGLLPLLGLLAARLYLR